MLLAITYEFSGQGRKAKEAAKKLLTLNPDLTIKKLRKMAPTKNLDKLERDIIALRKAGLPEK